jgi:hypothetical protein
MARGDAGDLDVTVTLTGFDDQMMPSAALVAAA